MVVLQQTPNGTAPILVTDHPPTHRSAIANIIATPESPQTAAQEPAGPRFNVHNPHSSLSLLWPHLVRSSPNPPQSPKKNNLTNHPRIELHQRCGPKRNLLTCPDFSSAQPRGPASIPHLHSLPCCTPEWDCPRCGDSNPDLRYKRLCEFRAAGIKVGRDANRDGKGVELVGVGCCAVM